MSSQEEMFFLIIGENEAQEFKRQGVLHMIKHSTHTDVSGQANDLSTSHMVRHIPLWISIVVIIGAVLTATGAVISKVDPTLLTNGSPMTEAARVYADYTFARNLSLMV